MVQYNWTYVSILFSEGSYGENGGKQLERVTRKRGICIAYSSMLINDPTSKEMSQIIAKLRQAEARVVVLFISVFHHNFLQHPDLLSGPPGEFIFIGSDSMQGKNFGNVLNGGVITFFPFGELPGKVLTN